MVEPASTKHGDGYLDLTPETVGEYEIPVAPLEKVAEDAVSGIILSENNNPILKHGFFQVDLSDSDYTNTDLMYSAARKLIWMNVRVLDSKPPTEFADWMNDEDKELYKTKWEIIHF